jgi:hypothetical protein
MLGIIGDTFRRLGRRMLATLLFILGLMLVAAPLSLLLPPGARIFLGVVVWLAGSAFAVVRCGETLGGWAILVAAAPTMITAASLPDLVAPLAGRHVAGISAAEAPQHPDAQGFDFSDSVVQTKYAASYRRTTRDRKSGRFSSTYYNIAPLTAADWTPADPVPAWAGCSDTFERACAEWRRAYRGAVPAEQLDQAHLRTAADQALAKHGLREAPGAPLLSRVESVDEGIRERAAKLLASAVFVYLVWLVPVLFIELLDGGERLWQHLRAAWARLREG